MLLCPDKRADHNPVFFGELHHRLWRNTQGIDDQFDRILEGSIVNVSSLTGQSGGNHVFGYSVSKHAVNGLTRSSANSLSRYGIRVNAVAPSQTDTQMMATMESDLSPEDPAKARGRLAPSIPMGRYARAEEVAAAICFLANEDASFVTGAILPVDGGYLTTI